MLSCILSSGNIQHRGSINVEGLFQGSENFNYRVQVMQAEALPAPPGDAGPRRIVPDAVAVSMPDAADTNSDFDFAASSEQETSVADGDSTELGVATQLQSIQEQLSELRQLVKRNLDNTS